MILQVRVIFFIVTAMAILMGLFLIRSGVKRTRKMKSWNRVSGVVTDKRIFTEKGNARPTVSYTIDDQTYEHTSAIGQNPPLRSGKEVDIYYDPDDPEKVIIDTFMQRGGFMKLAGSFFLGFGLLFQMFLKSVDFG